MIKICAAILSPDTRCPRCVHYHYRNPEAPAGKLFGRLQLVQSYQVVPQIVIVQGKHQIEFFARQHIRLLYRAALLDHRVKRPSILDCGLCLTYSLLISVNILQQLKALKPLACRQE